jgi:ABC-2 type transport system permease protein
MATVARSMPQFGLLLMLTLIPLEMLSGAVTPNESMPQAVRWLMSLAPTTHFVGLSQAILFRGAGAAIAWPSMLALAAIGAVLFGLSLARFRKTIAQMA